MRLGWRSGRGCFFDRAHSPSQAQIFGQIHRAHAALAKLAQDAVAGLEDLSNDERHSVSLVSSNSRTLGNSR